MSYGDFQKATTLIIRHPGQYTGEALETLFASLSLTQSEQLNLRALSQDRLAGKFGYNMTTIRRRVALNSMPVAKIFIPEELNKALWYELFEPQASKVRVFHLAYEYLSFLCSNKEATAWLQQACPEFIFDILRFERAQSFLRSYEMPDHSPLPMGTLLLTDRIVVEDFDFDVAGLARVVTGAKERPDPTRLQPDKRMVFQLMTSAKPTDKLSIFEIDGETFGFLKQQKEGGQVHGNLPSSYPDLIAAGLCQAVSADFGAKGQPSQ